MLSQEREVQLKLGSPGSSSPVVISSQDSISTNSSSPLPVYPSSTLTQHGNQTVTNHGASTSQSWRTSCVLSVAQPEKASLDRDKEYQTSCLRSASELNDGELPLDEEYMEDDFETYSIPDNFDDIFQEDAPPLISSSAAGPPRSQITTRTPSCNSASLQPMLVGNSGGPVPRTNISTQRIQTGKAATTGCGAKDDSAEFRGQYRHTKEMYKVFTQVQYIIL